MSGEVRGFKPADVEEPIDRFFHRPLADWLLVRPLFATPVSPDQLTLASGALSLLGGGALAWGQPGWGGLFLLVSVLLDCADGQLARLRGTSSALGRALDGVVDALAPTSILFGMSVYLQARGLDPRFVWPLAAAAGASLAWHASVYDALKNVYLARARPDFRLGGEPLLDEDDLARRAAEHRARGERGAALLMRVWLVWTRGQRRRLAPWRGQGAPEDAAAREAFVRDLRGPMRAAVWLGFGTHLFLLTVAAWLASLEPLTIVAALVLIAGPLNGWCLVVSARWRRAERRHLLATRMARVCESPPLRGSR